MKKIQKLVSVVGPFATIGQKVNEIIDANPPLEAGTGLIITRSESNILIGLDSSSIKNRIPPWFLTGIIVSGDAKISVNPGMVNNFVPTIGGTSLVAVPAPTITVTGASGLIQLKATVDSAGTITALIVENVAGPSVTADTVTLKYKLVGTWTASGGQFTSVVSILNTNQSLILCGGTAIFGA